MAVDKLITSEKGGNLTEPKIITNEEGEIVKQEDLSPLNLKDRISKSTLDGGLKRLPVGFDEQAGDWNCINSSNPFEVLYLDHQLYKYITPKIVKDNYAILEKFWREKVALLNTGGNRIAFKNKYGDGIIENSLLKLKISLEKLSTESNILQYAKEINNARLKKGEESLRESIEDMVVDDVVERSEIELRLERGIKYDLTEDEVVEIINRAIEKRNLKPYGKPEGNTSKEILLSVTWMSDDKIVEFFKIEQEKKKRGREIFDKVYAYSVEEIGTILFDNEEKAREYMREGLIINSIDYFSSSKARQILEINKSKNNELLKYLQIVYRLNQKLPFRFLNKEFYSLKELTNTLFDNPKLAKEYIKQGNIGIWLQETQPENYKKLIDISNHAENIDLAFLELIYTYNKELPYRFAGNIMVKTPFELWNLIDKNKENWNAAREELFNSSLLVWLKFTDKSTIVESWNAIKEKYLKSKDAGLEAFMHLLNNKLDNPELEVNEKLISFPKIQSGDKLKVQLVFRNKTRGFVESKLSFSKKLDGVDLSSQNISINIASGTSSTSVYFTIDSSVLLKGVDYSTNIIVTSSNNQELKIPVSFRLVFPKKAFIKEAVKYAFLFAIIAGIFRGIVSLLGFPNWIKESIQYYITSNDVKWQQKPEILYFQIILVFLIIIILILAKYWKRITRLMDKI